MIYLLKTEADREAEIMLLCSFCDSVCSQSNKFEYKQRTFSEHFFQSDPLSVIKRYSAKISANVGWSAVELTYCSLDGNTC